MLERPNSTRIEGKYTFQFGDHPIIQAGVAAAFVRDAHHHRDIVNSVYFDTPQLSYLREKVNSDYLKTKIRLRWYGCRDHPEPGRLVTAYLEVKRKQGPNGDKTRLPFQIPAEALYDTVGSFPGIRHLIQAVRDLGHVPVGPLFPMIAIRFDRTRFLDPLSGGRVSLDSGIGYTRINQEFFPGSEPRTLRYGVLEIKNETGDLPRPLLGIRNRLNKRDSFSKYEECWQLYADPLYRRGFQWMHFRR